MSSPRLIHVSVTDSAGRAVPLARVQVVRAPVSLPDVAGLTDAQGRCTLAAPQSGHYEVAVFADSIGNGQAAAKVGAKDVQLTIRLA